MSRNARRSKGIQLMSERITRANLEGTAEALTEVLRRAGVIEGDQRFLVLSGPGGFAFRLTGGSLGSGHSEGLAGLRRGFHPARDAWETASAVIMAVSETDNARRRRVAGARELAVAALREWSDESVKGTPHWRVAARVQSALNALEAVTR